MCGIVGYVGSTAPVSRQRLVYMRDTLSHRGPDDADLLVATDGPAVGFGHRRLSILDTRTVGRQPMTRGELTIVFNGEIYNFQVLRTQLEAEGHRFTTRTDTEVLLALYQTRGTDMLGLLNGMFAFAIWDRARQRVFLARDRLGIKPLFLAAGPGDALLFASEIKALLASKVVDDAIDLQAHHDYLGLTYVPGPRTMLRGVRQLPPAHAIVWEAGRTRQWRYWDQQLHSAGAKGARPPSRRQAASEVLAGLSQAVERRMIADVPLGMFLSGGIDSTAVLMCMAQAASAPVKAFTIRFEEASYDESEFARIAAQAYGAEHHIETVRPDPDTFLGPLTEALDQPYADSSAIPLWYLCRLARQHVTVALGGDGGDEVLAGYRTHVAWRVREVYRRLPKAAREKLIPALVARLPVSHGKISFDLKARQFVAAANRPPAAAHFGYKEFLAEDARHALRAVPAQLEPTVRLFEQAFAAHDFSHGLDPVLYSDQAIYLPDNILVKADRMSMRHGLEARVPFLDHAFVEQVAALPADYKLHRWQTKAVLKRALAGKVPPVLLKRRKAGFNVPMAAWLAGPLHELMRDMLSPSRVRAVGLWRADQVESLIDDHLARRRDLSRPLWSMLCFMLFNERFRGGRSA